MVKPVIPAVDDPQVLRADSGESTLGTLGKLKFRGDPAALFLVYQRMPSMIGVEFLEEVIERIPDDRRAPLAACPATEAAIREITEGSVDSKSGAARIIVRLLKSDRENGG